ncbi:MAG: NAD(+) synthase [Bacillota bacterium]
MQVQDLVPALVNWLEQQLSESGCKGYVVGLSGGIDSAIVAVLCKKACPKSVLGVIMPCFSDKSDAQDAETVARLFDIPFVTVCLDETYRLLAETLSGKPFDELDHRDISLANLKPRLRMATLYFFANKRQALVAGTGNRSELVIGYFTKYGDGGVDVLPIGNLLKFQVKEVAAHLGIPKAIIDRRPSAGLWKGHDDAGELGFTYEELDHFILTGEAPPDIREKIEYLSAKNRHKLRMPPIPGFGL